jgi:hypothetical protein
MIATNFDEISLNELSKLHAASLCMKGFDELSNNLLDQNLKVKDNLLMALKDPHAFRVFIENQTFIELKDLTTAVNLFAATYDGTYSDMTEWAESFLLSLVDEKENPDCDNCNSDEPCFNCKSGREDPCENCNVRSMDFCQDCENRFTLGFSEKEHKLFGRDLDYWLTHPKAFAEEIKEWEYIFKTPDGIAITDVAIVDIPMPDGGVSVFRSIDAVPFLNPVQPIVD